MARTSGRDRDNPKHVMSLNIAVWLAETSREAIWVRIAKYPGVYKVYPGGRSIHYPERQPRYKQESGT